jgi:hypothetical protein
MPGESYEKEPSEDPNMGPPVDWAYQLNANRGFEAISN